MGCPLIEMCLPKPRYHNPQSFLHRHYFSANPWAAPADSTEKIILHFLTEMLFVFILMNPLTPSLIKLMFFN